MSTTGFTSLPRAGLLLLCRVVAVAVIVFAPEAVPAQDDPFVRQRDAEAARRGSDGFSIAFAGDQRVFRPGEAISITFTFRRKDISPFNYEHCNDLGLSELVLDHRDGVVDPQADLWNNGVVTPSCGLLSGAPGGVVRGLWGGPVPDPEPRPIEFVVHLN